VVSPIAVRSISHEQHLAFVRAQPRVSFLQTPAWGAVKTEWRAESLGWFRAGDLVGAGLVLHRALPVPGPLGRRTLAYLPEGPVIDWGAADLDDWLDPMARLLKARGAFAIRMGPPVVTRRWSAERIKAGLADPAYRHLDDLAPTTREALGARVVSGLRDLGWQEQGAAGGGFAAGQPRHNFQVSLVDSAGAPLEEAAVLAGMNQLWRRNIKKADKAGVQVTPSTEAADLKAFHDLYVHTAERDHFTPRPLAYFETMLARLGAEEPDRITVWSARHEGDLVASTIGIRVGEHAWYSYGASSTEKREVRGSNAVQWAMMRDALARGATVYDLRGITDTLDPEDPHAGLIQFKVGTGGEVVEYAGEWDLPLRPLLYRAFQVAQARRGRRS